MFAPGPTSARDNDSALGFQVDLNRMDVVSAVEISHELCVNICTADGVGHPSDYESLVALSCTGSVNEGGFVLVGVPGCPSQSVLHVTGLRVKLLLSNIIILGDPIVWLFVTEEQAVSFKDYLGLYIMDQFKFPAKPFEILVFLLVQFGDVFIYSDA